MQSRKNIVDFNFLNMKRVDNLHYELMKDVNEGASASLQDSSATMENGDPAKGTKAILASTLSKTSNVLQFQELFLKATVSAGQKPSVIKPERFHHGNCPFICYPAIFCPR